MSGYTPLTQEERYQIDLLKKASHHQAERAATQYHPGCLRERVSVSVRFPGTTAHGWGH